MSYDAGLLMGKVGRTKVERGSIEPFSLDPSGGARVIQSRAAFYDAVMRGNCYGVANQAGVTTQAGFSGTTPVLTLYNPAGSGVNGIVWYTGVTFSVAFAAAAVVYVAVGTDTTAAAVTGTLTTTHRNLLLGASAGNKIKAYLSATLPAAPVGVSILGVGLTGAITTVPTGQMLDRWFAGALILKPGANLSIQTSAASGASATFCEYLWEEVDEE